MLQFNNVTGKLPIVNINPKNTFVSVTSNVALSCEADGATSYNWERQSGSIPSGAIGVNTNTLTIINLQLKDAGKYRCVATNGSGRAVSDYAQLIINCKIFVLDHVFNLQSFGWFYFYELLILYVYTHEGNHSKTQSAIIVIG